MRLRRVRFKDGRAPIEILRKAAPSTEISDDFSRSIVRCAETSVGGAAMVGFAIVAWADSGEVFVTYRNGDRSPVPGGGVGQYAKDILQAEQTIRWSKD